MKDTRNFTRHHAHNGIKRVAMTLRVPVATHKQLRQRALHRKMTLNDYLLTLITNPMG